MQNSNKVIDVILVSPAASYTLGIKYLHSVLLKNNFSVCSLALTYCNEKEKDLVIEFIKNKQPLVVGFTVFSQSLRDIIDITKRLKRTSNSFIVWGGPHPTIDPEECLKYADGICIGDGENLIVDLVGRVKEKKSLKGIKNLWFKERRKIIKNETGDFIKDFNMLPFPYFFEDNFYFVVEQHFYSRLPYRIMPKNLVVTSLIGRYCPYACSYCINSVVNKSRNVQEKKHVRNIIEELKSEMKRGRVGYIVFADDIFPTDDSFLEPFVFLYKKHIRLNFAISTHPLIFNLTKYELLRDAGLWTCKIGIQTASEKILKIYNRPSSNKKIIKVYGKSRKLHISILIDIIISPFETLEDTMKTANLVFQLRKYSIIVFHNLLFYKNYPITKFCLEQKIIKEEDIIGINSVADQSIVNFEYMNKSQIKFYLIMSLSSLGIKPNIARMLVMKIENHDWLLLFSAKMILIYNNKMIALKLKFSRLMKFINADLRLKRYLLKLFLSNFMGKRVNFFEI